MSGARYAPPGTRSNRCTCRVRRSKTPRNEGPLPERPDDGRGLQPEDAFQFVEEGERVARRPVALVHEGEDRHAPPAAHLEELARLRLDALARVDHHERGVHGREHAVGVLGEVLVAGGVEQVDRVAAVVELEHGRADGNAALRLELHPVRGGGALVLAVLDRAGQVDRVAVQQELLGQRRLARVGMGDDREGASAGDFGGWGHCKRDIARSAGRWQGEVI